METSGPDLSHLDFITIRGAKEHNLKGIDLAIPRNQITVITGLSGSGKSSLAFDTIYAEGQRRYVESMSSYARQFLDQLKKPEVESISGLSPAIAIDQKSVGSNPRSTVGTITEIYDYMRLLYAKVGTPHCPEHHFPMVGQNPSQIREEVLKLKSGAKVLILAPVAQGKKGEFLAEFQKWAKKGFVKARVDGVFIELEKAQKLSKHKAHDIDLVVDQLIIKAGIENRLVESIHTSLILSNGRVVIEVLEGDRGKEKVVDRKGYSIHSACPQCGLSFPEMEPRLFSFNNPRGACPDCNGLGTLDIIERETFDDEGGGRVLKSVSYESKKKVAAEDDEEILEEDFQECPTCEGRRLRPESLAVTIEQKNIAELSKLSSEDLLAWIRKIQFSSKESLIADKIVRQIEMRLEFLERVGAGYLSLERSARSLSGGEAQRIRLATQVGSGLIGVLYIMDEPSIGLHPRDHRRLLDILHELRNKGNTILLVEHDEETIRSADYVVDIGPGAGVHGGNILARGKPEEIAANPNSITGQYLSGIRKIAVPQQRRLGNGTELRLLGAQGNNLQGVDVAIPLGTFVAVTGVSGSGKSTLIIDTLYRILSQHFYSSSARPATYKKIEGLQHLDKVIEINQRPIGRTSRSTPSTYVGLFPMIRDLYAQLPEAKILGFEPGRFSFNVKGGRCEVCQGHGQVKMEMHFLADVSVHCEACNGKRYNRDTLNLKYRGKSIADVLEMTVQEALEFFQNHPQIRRKLETLNMVGLDYLHLGQSSTTLSGGEAQRVKLSKELSKRGTGKTFYILDEPTTGLHFEDVRKLIDLLQELVNQGNTVLVIEHNLDVVKCADFIIDMGPEGGSGGGQLIAAGAPEEVIKNPRSITGQFLKSMI